MRVIDATENTMHRFIIGRLGQTGFPDELATAMFRQRHEIFCERLGWDVRSVGGLERDEFDDADTVYIVARNLATQRVDASWRLRPTTLPNMLRDTFPGLLHGQPAPCDDRVWEVSRFAVAHSPYEEYEEGVCSFGALTQDLVATTVDYAMRSGIRGYVWVTSVGVERLALKLGYRPRRLGRPLRLGKVLSVAAHLPIDRNTCELALQRLGQPWAAAA